MFRDILQCNNLVALTEALLFWFSYYASTIPVFLIIIRCAYAPYKDWQLSYSMFTTFGWAVVFYGIFDTFLCFNLTVIAWVIGIAFGIPLYAAFCKLSQKVPGRFYLFRCYSALLSVATMCFFLTLDGAGHVYFAYFSRVQFIDSRYSDLQVC